MASGGLSVTMTSGSWATNSAALWSAGGYGWARRGDARSTSTVATMSLKGGSDSIDDWLDSVGISLDAVINELYLLSALVTPSR